MPGLMRRDVKTVCPYCGVGCGMIATAVGDRIVRVRGDRDHPANFGRLCQKGATVAVTVHAPSRLHYPMLRSEDGELTIVSAETAIDQTARRLEKIIQCYGPGTVGFYLSGQLTTESQYLAAKFARACLRTNHVDSNSRLCMASAASGMSLSLGSDGPPTCYADIELADAFVFVGSNAAECHPVLFDRVRDRLRNRHTRCIVVDPRHTATAEVAHVHLAIRPGSDLVLMNGLLRMVRDAGKLDHAFIQSCTEGWDALNELLEQYGPKRVVDLCGISPDELNRAAQIIIENERMITFWTMGVNQTMQGTATSNAIINLHLATGRIGKPGCGPFSLTGQPNAMGGRDCGYMSHALPGQRLVADAAHRTQIEQLWGLPPGHLPSEPGYDAVRMFDALGSGELKAIWIIGTNPAASMPNLPRVRDALSKARLVIVQDAYHPTETTRFAHVILPAAVNFEQTGVFTNSERRVTLMEQVVAPPGQAKPDWWWIQAVARAMGFERRMSFTSAAEIFDEFARCTAGRPNDQSALHHELLRHKGPQPWPYPALGRPSQRRYVQGQFPTATGKARFWARPHEMLAEGTDGDFPLILTTGRLINHWHTRTKTGLVRQLNEQAGCASASMNPTDAQSLSLKDGQPVRVVSRRGQTRSILRCDTSIPPGIVFLPIHFNDLFAPGASPNEATTDSADPTSRQPALKYCAVRVEPDDQQSVL